MPFFTLTETTLQAMGTIVFCFRSRFRDEFFSTDVFPKACALGKINASKIASFSAEKDAIDDAI